MTMLFALFFVEKNWRHGLAVEKLAGIALMVLGVAVLANPRLLAAISN